MNNYCGCKFKHEWQTKSLEQFDYTSYDWIVFWGYDPLRLS